tara:strand:- start:328 stop:951 length:624 start_codon:yes stop_codon:yes gene_type:complete
MEQYSDEWWKARLGKATASKIADIMTKTKSGYSAGRKNYEAQLIAERLTGISPPSFTNDAMRHGTETEPQAREAYEFANDVVVVEVGFIDHPTILMSGASPDGVVGEGLLEIKCPNTSTHLDILIGGKVPKKYITQMMWQMACMEKEWCDFVSFDPRLPEAMQMFVARVHYDKDVVADMENEVVKFLGEVDAKVKLLKEKFEIDCEF